MVADFKKKQKKHPFGGMLPMMGFLLIMAAAVGLSIGNVKIYQKRKEFLAQVATLKAKTEDLQKSNHELQQGIAKSDDSAYIEKVAREELDLQKEGEHVVSFIMPKDQKNPANQNSNTMFGAWSAWMSSVWNGIFKR